MTTNPYQQDWRQYPQSWPPPSPYPAPNRRPVIIAAVVAALAGLLVGVVIGGAVVFVLGVTGVFDPKPLTYGPGGSIAQFELRAGQCADGEVKAGRSYPTAKAVACSGRHDFEVYETASTPGPDVADAGYPDPRDLAAFADDHCLLAFEAYVGSSIDDSDLDYAGVVPSRDAWDAGDHTVACALWQVDGDRLSGSARDSHRCRPLGREKGCPVITVRLMMVASDGLETLPGGGGGEGA